MADEHACVIETPAVVKGIQLVKIPLLSSLGRVVVIFPSGYAPTDQRVWGIFSIISCHSGIFSAEDDGARLQGRGDMVFFNLRVIGPGMRQRD